MKAVGDRILVQADVRWGLLEGWAIVRKVLPHSCCYDVSMVGLPEHLTIRVNENGRQLLKEPQ